jgi:hypothetical protein
MFITLVGLLALLFLGHVVLQLWHLAYALRHGNRRSDAEALPAALPREDYIEITLRMNAAARGPEAR